MGERFIHLRKKSKPRCRAITTTAEQCRRGSEEEVDTPEGKVALCRAHAREWAKYGWLAFVKL